MRKHANGASSAFSIGSADAASPRRARAAVLLLGAALACTGHDTAAERRRIEAAHDSELAAVQARGERAMGVDQYTSTHLFTPLPDGGRIELERDQPDSAGAAQIRDHMKRIAAAFQAGDFSLPEFVHARDVPGTAEMAAKRDAISYTVELLPHGAALRLRSSDPGAVDAIHRFLAFQRQDHHASAHHAM